MVDRSWYNAFWPRPVKFVDLPDLARSIIFANSLTWIDLDKGRNHHG